jgi:hypothetical protein
MKPFKLTILLTTTAVTAALGLLLGPPAAADEGDPQLLRLIYSINDGGLKPQWLDYRVEQIELFTVGEGRPGARLHQQPYRWVAGDPRRGARDGALTYLTDPSWGASTANGVPREATAGAIERAMETWAASPCLGGVDLLELGYPGGDVTIFDYFLDEGEFGDPFQADIVHAGWFGADAGLFGPEVLGISVTFIFVDPVTGEPTDLDGDRYLDTAASEIYYSDVFPWTLDSFAGTEEGIDLETVALHEAGHALGIGHFESPPEGVMNPVYAGVRRELYPIDLAGLCTVWGSATAP